MIPLLLVFVLALAACMSITGALCEHAGYDAGLADGVAIERARWLDRSHARTVTSHHRDDDGATVFDFERDDRARVLPDELATVLRPPACSELRVSYLDDRRNRWASR